MLRVLSMLCLVGIITCVRIGTMFGDNGHYIIDLLLCGLGGFFTAVYGDLCVAMFLEGKNNETAN